MIAGTPREARGDTYSLLWWQGGFRAMDSLEGPGGREQKMIAGHRVLRAFAQ